MAWFVVAARRFFGVLALVIGTSLLVWLVYNLFWPTPEFKQGYKTPVQLILPFAMLYVGWHWIRGRGLRPPPSVEGRSDEQKLDRESGE
ncbi:MAG TPA: hypothetical protein VHG32_23855 [Thermoanaerobaculia bacterium]|nr:hypothetical protein [Thermoanaerobaculia bacterium]